MAKGTEITSSSQMSRVATNLEEIIGKYNQCINNLYTSGGELDNMWKGESSQTFKAQFEDDRERFMALSKMLREYVETLNKDVAIYVKMEQDVIVTIKNKRR